jgi:hypothetical protein
MEMTTMRTLLFIALAALLTAPNGIAAAEPSNADGLACFATLNAPEYPQQAINTHTTGDVWTWTQVSAQGTPGDIKTQVVSAWSDGAKLLTPPVEKAIREAKFKPECAGKEVRAVFRYQTIGQSPDGPQVTSRTDGDYLMFIEGRRSATANASAAKH